MKELDRLRDAFEAFYIRKDASPLAFAYEISRHSPDLQGPFFETALAFLQEVAGQTYTDALMQNYQQIARDMLDNS